MGGVNILHGVSGGTVAFVTGIYDRWITALSAFDKEAFSLLFRLQLQEFNNKVDGRFLVSLLAGMLTGVLALSPVLFFLIKRYPVPLHAFFFGVVIIAAPLALRKVHRWNVGTALALVAGIAIAYGLTSLTGFISPDSFWFLFLCGFLASCGLVWPGISISFILLLLGKYGYIVTAFDTMNLRVLLFFIPGFATGLICNARITRAFLVHYHHTAVALLAGLMLGALNKLWPWRAVTEFLTNRKGEQIPAFDHSILPWHFMASTGKDPQVFQAILMVALGMFMVVLTEKIGARLKTKI